MSRQRRTHNGIPQLQLRLVEVCLAHDNRSLRRFVSSLRIIQIQLARRVLRIQGTDTLQVALGLQSLRLILFQLRTCLIRLSAVLVLVDNEQYLVLGYIRTFIEKHAFQVTLHTRTDFDELLRADTSYIFAKNLHIAHLGRFHDYSGRFRLYFLRPGQYQIAGKQHRHAGYHHYHPFFSQL